MKNIFHDTAHIYAYQFATLCKISRKWHLGSKVQQIQSDCFRKITLWNVRVVIQKQRLGPEAFPLVQEQLELDLGEHIIQQSVAIHLLAVALSNHALQEDRQIV